MIFVDTIERPPFQQERRAQYKAHIDIDGGLTTVAATHSGSSNFQVSFVPANGDFDELFVNEIGAYEGGTTFRFEGVGFVDVQADGEYPITIE